MSILKAAKVLNNEGILFEKWFLWDKSLGIIYIWTLLCVFFFPTFTLSSHHRLQQQLHVVNSLQRRKQFLQLYLWWNLASANGWDCGAGAMCGCLVSAAAAGLGSMTCDHFLHVITSLSFLNFLFILHYPIQMKGKKCPKKKISGVLLVNSETDITSSHLSYL